VTAGPEPTGGEDRPSAAATPDSEGTDDRRVVYLDASAIVRWVVREPGWRDLRDYLIERPTRVASRIVDVEVRRAVARASIAGADERVERVLERIAKLELDASLAAEAGRLGPTGLRTLDAIHLASALALGPQLDALVTYDTRLADAAIANGLEVVAPGG
jgi:predicted nucleic acid-binding protein